MPLDFPTLLAHASVELDELSHDIPNDQTSIQQLLALFEKLVAEEEDPLWLLLLRTPLTMDDVSSLVQRVRAALQQPNPETFVEFRNICVELHEATSGLPKHLLPKIQNAEPIVDKPETVVLKRTSETFDGLVGYSSPGVGVTVFLHRAKLPDEIQVTITPLRSEQAEE